MADLPYEQLNARRKQLGMSKRALARRAGVSEPTVHRILSGREVNPSLGSLQSLAAAVGATLTMDLRFPSTGQEFAAQEARRKAQALTGMVQGTMALEAQAVDEFTLAEIRESAAAELLRGSTRRLWDE